MENGTVAMLTGAPEHPGTRGIRPYHACFVGYINPIPIQAGRLCPPHCTEVPFASFFSGGFITAIVVNPPERRLAKRTSVHWLVPGKFRELPAPLSKKVQRGPQRPQSSTHSLEARH